MTAPIDEGTVAWRRYEEVVRYLLHKLRDEFGFERVETDQKAEGHRTGTVWRLDAKGIVDDTDNRFVIIECKRYTKSRPNQEQVGGLAFRILDTGAEGGIIVTPMGLQEGAKRIASAENIMEVKVAADSTPEHYLLTFMEKIFAGVTLNVCIVGTCEVSVMDYEASVTASELDL